jgi:hypothetical protein
LLLGAHYYRVSRIHGISLPLHASAEKGKKDTGGRTVDFIPHVLTQELLLTCLGLFLLVGAALFFYDAPLEHHADPRKTPLDTQAPWFFLWVQGLLKLGDKTLMGVVVPTLIFSVLVALPYIDRSPRRALRRRPVAVAAAACAAAAILTLSYMGTHRYGLNLPPASRIVQDLAPEEGMGLLHTVPHDQLTVGIYPASETDRRPLPSAFHLVLSRFKDRVEEAGQQGLLADADAVMIVEDWQVDLKRVTLRILWTDSANGKRNTYERIVHLHRERDGGDV